MKPTQENARAFYEASFTTSGRSASDPQAVAVMTRFAQACVNDALAEAVKALERIRDVCEYASRHAHGMYGFTKYVEAHGTVTATVQEALQKIAALDAAGGDTND